MISVMLAISHVVMLSIHVWHKAHLKHYIKYALFLYMLFAKSLANPSQLVYNTNIARNI